MALTPAAVRGALGFLSRLPVGSDESAWDAFRTTPTAFPLAGYALGALLSLPLLAPVPPATVAPLFVGWTFAVTGVNHVDGVADLGDAAAVHGSPEARREVMKDTAVGTGGAGAVAFVVLGLGTAAVALASAFRGDPAGAVGLIVAVEVGAKATMALLVCLGSAPHEGLGSALTANSTARGALPVTVVAAPAALATWPRVVPSAVALATAVVVGLATRRWARASLGGVSGDVLGATNEFARVAALHAGVVSWTLS